MVRTEKDFAAADAAKRRKEKRKKLKEKEATTKPMAVSVDLPKKAKSLSANWQTLSKTLGIAKNSKKGSAGHATSAKKPKQTEKRVLEKILSESSRAGQSADWLLEDDEGPGMGGMTASARPVTAVAAVSASAKDILASKDAPPGHALPTKQIAIDCEMVGVGPGGYVSALARCSIVNKYGEVLLDTFVRPTERIVDFRTEHSGIRPADIMNAPTLEEIQPKVKELMQGRILVGHHISHDLRALRLPHPRRDIRDTSLYPAFRSSIKGLDKRPALRHLASSLLGMHIQGGEHSSLEDAQATMALYRKNAKTWEKDLTQRRFGKQKAASKPAQKGGLFG